jgi:hypothetical protein
MTGDANRPVWVKEKEGFFPAIFASLRGRMEIVMLFGYDLCWWRTYALNKVISHMLIGKLII